MSELCNFIICIVEMNLDNNIFLSKNNVYKNKIFNEIICKNKIDKHSKEKLYIFLTELIKFDNKKILKHLKKLDKNISDLFFKYIIKTKVKNIKKFSALFLQFYMYNKLSIEELEKCFLVISQLDSNYFDFIWGTEREGTKCFNEKYGKILKDNEMAENIFKIGEIEYKLNDIGEKFLKNIYLDITNKEKRYYSKIIDLKVMESLMNAKEHKEYYNSIINKIGENDSYIKMIRVHEGLYKDLLEEYDVLIKYSIAKYGENCKIRFCGQETKKQIKCDGIIVCENTEEKIEITYPFFGEDENNEMKQLNNFGHSPVKTMDLISYKKSIRNRIEKKINEKNSSKSYDESVILVVMMDMFYFLFDSETGNKAYYDDLLGYLKTRSYKFKNVDILIDKYSKDTEPWIYRIK